MSKLLIGEGCEVRYHQPDRDYRRAQGRSQSELKEVLRSPAHWLARYGPNAEPSFPSAAMIIGTAFHAKVLEPEAFDGRFYDRSQAAKPLSVAALKAALAQEQVEIPKGGQEGRPRGPAVSRWQAGGPAHRPREGGLRARQRHGRGPAQPCRGGLLV